MSRCLSRVFFLSVLSLLALILASRATRTVKYEEFHYLEFEIVSFSMLFAQGAQPYQPTSIRMVPLGIYTPLTHLVPAWVARAVGTVGSPKAFLFTFRLVVFLYILGSITALYLVLRRFGVHQNAALLLCPVLLAAPWFVQSARPDWQALFYVIVVWLVLQRQPWTARHALVAGALCAVAFLHLQRCLSLFPALLLVYLAHRRFRDAGLSIAAFVGTCLLVLAPVLLYSGGAMFTHTFTMPRLYAIRVPGWPPALAHPYGFLVLLAVAVWAYVDLIRAHPPSLPLWCLALYVPFCLAWTLYTIQTAGAVANQLLESVVALILCVGVSVPGRGEATGARDEGRGRRWRKAVVMALCSLNIAWLALGEARYWRAEILGVRAKYDQTVSLDADLRQLDHGPLLADDPAIAYRAGHPEAANQPWFFFDVLGPRGMFDPGPTATAILQRHYASIILRKDSQVYDVFKAPIDTAYHMTREKGGYRFWVPTRLPDLGHATSDSPASPR